MEPGSPPPKSTKSLATPISNSADQDAEGSREGTRDAVRDQRDADRSAEPDGEGTRDAATSNCPESEGNSRSQCQVDAQAGESATDAKPLHADGASRPRRQKRNGTQVPVLLQSAKKAPRVPRNSGQSGILEQAAPGASGGALASGHVPGTGNDTQPMTAGGDVTEDDGSDERAREMRRLQQENETMREQWGQQRKRLHSTTAALRQSRQCVSRALVQIAKNEDQEERTRAEIATWHLGRCRVSAPGLRSGRWEGGSEGDEIGRVRDRICEDRRLIERLRRQLARASKARGDAAAVPEAETTQVPQEDDSNVVDDDGEVEEIFERREVCNHRTALLAREELALKDREHKLQVDRTLHLKRQQRLQAAENSNFRNYPLLADRYQLLNMIGRGGFSEVFRAYDLEGNRFCAVKIHELGKDMSDQQRQSYIRRAMREYDIQKTLKHSRVVTLADCFPISTKAFGTVLELCEGDTLDEFMKRNGALPEREARGIVIQILSGLKYMNTNGRKIIHYDLKPGNLFFSCGEIKIADFGLSKIVQENYGESIDLTSQGAGTYWYLPPECFVGACQEEPPKISNKVDVWSTGVIFFELLFHRRPFGHGQSQEALLRTAMAGTPFAVEIPAAPKVSNDAKEFIKRLLTINRDRRPDVIEAFSDPYLRQKSRPVSSAPMLAPPPPGPGGAAWVRGIAVAS